MGFVAAFARAMRIPLKFDPTAPLLALLVALGAPWLASEAESTAAIAVVLLAAGVGFLAHEWAHAAAATLAGGRPGAIRMHGFGASVSRW